jgi:hypothetical protein
MKMKKAVFKLPRSANLFNSEDVLLLLSQHLGTTPEEALKQVTHHNHVVASNLAECGEIIARSDLGSLRSYKLEGGKKVDGGSDVFKGETLIVLRRRGKPGRTSAQALRKKRLQEAGTAGKMPVRYFG